MKGNPRAKISISKFNYKKTKIFRIKTKRSSEMIYDTCGGEYTMSLNQNLKIQSPNYPNHYDSNLRCNYYIKSPSNTKISLKLIDVDLEESSKNVCIDGLEVRYYSLGQPGPMFVKIRF